MAIEIKVIVSADNKWQSWRLWNHRATAVTVIYSLITWCHQNTFEVCCHLYYVIWTSHCKRECFMINRPLVFICSKQTTGCNLRPFWSATHVMLWCCCVVYWYSGVFTRSSIRHASSISLLIKIYVWVALHLYVCGGQSFCKPPDLKPVSRLLLCKEIFIYCVLWNCNI